MQEDKMKEILKKLLNKIKNIFNKLKFKFLNIISKYKYDNSLNIIITPSKYEWFKKYK